MIVHNEGVTTIKCDKCGFEESADADSYNEAFYESGWVVNPRGKLYKHKCRDCQTTAEKKASDFVREKFPIKHS
jgi:ribosomal protein S27E